GRLRRQGHDHGQGPRGGGREEGPLRGDRRRPAGAGHGRQREQGLRPASRSAQQNGAGPSGPAPFAFALAGAAQNSRPTAAQVRYASKGRQRTPAARRSQVEPMLPPGFSQLHSHSRRTSPTQASATPG